MFVVTPTQYILPLAIRHQLLFARNLDNWQHIPISFVIILHIIMQFLESSLDFISGRLVSFISHKSTPFNCSELPPNDFHVKDNQPPPLFIIVELSITNIFEPSLCQQHEYSVSRQNKCSRLRWRDELGCILRWSLDVVYQQSDLIRYSIYIYIRMC